MLKVVDLRKRYGDIVAVDNVSFEVERGTCYGLLGPNGAGKTTTISILSGLIAPESGQAFVADHPSGSIEAKRLLGVVPQELALYEELSAHENLLFFGTLYGLDGDKLRDAISHALVTAQLEDRAREPVSKFSGGMKRRLNIAASLLHRPEALILDEPTVGVDPQSRNAIFDVLKSLQEQGTTLLYTTHYMEEAERLCNRIGIMDRGKLIAEDTVGGLLRTLPASNRLIVDFAEGPPADLTGAPAMAGLKSLHAEGTTLVADLEDVATNGPALLTWLQQTGQNFTGFRSEQATLEDVFLKLTGRTLRDE